MKLSTYVIAIPVAVVAGVLAIANRQLVLFSLDPFSAAHPAAAVSVRLPLFVLLLITLALGAVLGGVAALLSRRGKTGSGGKSGLPARPGGAKPPQA